MLMQSTSSDCISMLPEPYAGLAEGILLGVDAGISNALYDRFNAIGTSHVLVI